MTCLKRSQRIYILSLLIIGLSGCLGVPEGTVPVKDFELEKYLGTWYEIARLNHSFERGLSNVTAEYSLRDDGGVRVINRGFETSSGKWSEAEGKAYFISESTVGQLKVSFFGPFYGAYNVIALDKEAYQWALVVGPDTNYLWILSRTPVLEKTTLDQLVSQVKFRGFQTEELIFVSHQQN